MDDTVPTPTHATAVPARALLRPSDLPGPRGLPWLGNALQIDTPRMHLQLEAWCRTYGPRYTLRLGGRHLVVIADHGAVVQILRDRPDGFRRTSRLQQVGSEMGLLPGLFSVEGEAWKRQRRMVMAAFDPAHVRRYHPSLQKVAERLASRWTLAARQGMAIDLQSDLMRYTVDAVAGLAFGADVNTLQSDGDVIQQHLDKVFPALLKRLFAPIPYWRYVRLPADRQLERSVAAVRRAVDQFIDQARARLAADPALRGQPANLLEAMVVAADAEGSGIDNAQIAGNVFTMLLAGEDTTANTLAWMVDLLWRHPAALARATEEVRSAVPDRGAPTMEQLARLDYVEACAHETMRLKPVAAFIGLQALRDTVVGDLLVPAGTVVLNLMRHDSVSDTHVPRAAAFEPERWLADGGPAQQASDARRVSTPFGAGPRTCPGRYLALLEIKMAMATLLGHFDITGVDTPDGQPAQERFSFTMMPVGLRMRVRERAA